MSTAAKLGAVSESDSQRATVGRVIVDEGYDVQDAQGCFSGRKGDRAAKFVSGRLSADGSTRSTTVRSRIVERCDTRWPIDSDPYIVPPPDRSTTAPKNSWFG